MSLLLDHYRSVQGMSVPNKGSGTTSQPTTSGFSGYTNASGPAPSYGEEDLPRKMGPITSEKNITPYALPQQGMSNSQQFRSYAGMANSALGVSSLLLRAAGDYYKNPTLTGVGSGIGRAAGVLGLGLTAYDIAKTGRVTPTQAASVSSVAAPYAISTINSATGAGIGANTVGLGAGTIGGVGTKAAVGAGTGTAAGLYAAAAIAGRMGLSAILSNQSNKVPQIQGRLMQEPTFEGLSSAAATEVAKMFHTSERNLGLLKETNKALDPVGTLMKNEWNSDVTKNILTGGARSEQGFFGKKATAVINPFGSGLSAIQEGLSNNFGKGKSEREKESAYRSYMAYKALNKLHKTNPEKYKKVIQRAKNRALTEVDLAARNQGFYTS